ncbi:MAG: ABC transporter permease [Clostridiales bacterium]|nr:ABC transporter permease [Clostridiales bacterium]
MKKSNNALSLYVLVKRNITLYMKDRMTVMFSVLAPIIVLLIYILFLGDLQVESISGMLGEYGLEGVLQKSDIQALINNWMIAGVMGVSCVTVAINANIVMVRDKMNGSINDILASPVKRWVIYASYIISCFLITFCICLIVLLLSIVYLAATGGLMLSFVDFLSIFGSTILSTLSSAFLATLICSFIKSTGTLAALNGIFGTAMGFLIGAYLPFSMMPKFMQYMACFIPGTYSAGLFRNFFLKGVLSNFSAKLPPESNIIETLMENYSIRLELFGTEISAGYMALALIFAIVLFASLLLIFYSNKKTNFFAVGKKRKKAKSKRK